MTEFTRVSSTDGEASPRAETRDRGRNRDRDHIVVGIDGSEESIEALRLAAVLAEPLRAALRVLAVWHSPDYASWNPEADAVHAARDSVREVFGDRVPSGLEILTAAGDTVDVLVEASRDARMLVLGRRGRTGLTRLLGSVSSACLSRAECPVLVTHAGAFARQESIA